MKINGTGISLEWLNYSSIAFYYAGFNQYGYWWTALYTVCTHEKRIVLKHNKH